MTMTHTDRADRAVLALRVPAIVLALPPPNAGPVAAGDPQSARSIPSRLTAH